MNSRLNPPDHTAPLGRTTPMIMALACGISVANVYFPQAVTPLIADGFGIAPGAAATVATVTQFGYAAGIFLLVPLGDRFRPRPLILTLLAGTGLALLAAGLSPAIGPLLAASAAVGLATVIPQILIPVAAGMVGTDRRGAVIGTLQGGLIGGILLARTFGGVLGDRLGWRAPYLVAAVLAALLAVVLNPALPANAPAARDRYPALLAGTVRMLCTEPDLRRSVLYQATLFGGFSAAWTTLALLVTGPGYELGTQTVGVLALIGAASMLGAPSAGRWVDRRGADRVTLWCILATAAATAILTAAAAGGRMGLTALVAGLLLLDLAMQASQVANQARILALRSAAGSRLNTAYMSCAFLGGGAGSLLGIRTYGRFGWLGVCVVMGLATTLALTTHLTTRRPVIHYQFSSSSKDLP